MKKTRKNKSGFGIKLLLTAFLTVVLICILCYCGRPSDSTPSGEDGTSTDSVSVTPVITGVKNEIVVYEDDPAETIKAALLEGVYTADGDPCTVKTTVYTENGQETETFTAGNYKLVYSCDREDVLTVQSVLIVKPADVTPPTIEGVTDKFVPVGSTLSYREGITVTDNDDTTVQLQVDASKVDLSRLGVYPLYYSAVDKRGNLASVSATVTVIESPDVGNGQTTSVCTKEELDALCMSILDKIITDDMTDYEKANAIYNRVRQIKYVGNASKEHWIAGAYTGLTTGRGDCFNYYSASKALLTLAGIPNYDLKRVGGTSDHYWQIVYVNGGWYHFDACPTPDEYPIRCFLYTEEEVVAYSKKCALVRPNYYVYDYANCPYEVVQSRN